MNTQFSRCRLTQCGYSTIFRAHRFAGWIGRVTPLALAVLAALASTADRLAAQTNGVWGVTAAGSGAGTNLWSAKFNWQSFTAADGTGATADFSQLTMTNNVTVQLDTPRNIGNLIFGDLGNAYNWTLDNNGSAGNTLMLVNPLATPVISTVQPSITVNNGTTTIDAVITGTQGLVVNPAGGNGTLVLTGANTFYDAALAKQRAERRLRRDLDSGGHSEHCVGRAGWFTLFCRGESLGLFARGQRPVSRPRRVVHSGRHCHQRRHVGSDRNIPN